MAQPVPILMYHSIDRENDSRPDRWSLSPTLFAEHMHWLAQHDYHPITISALVAARATGMLPSPRTVAITFDDGLQDFLTEAMPILQRHRFPATLYVVTGCVGKTSRWSRSLGESDKPMLSWSELRTVSGLGIECGAHTHTHPQLDIVPRAAAFAEVRRSKAALEDHLGCAVHSFAYPHGYASATTRRLVQEAGFASACRVRHALSSTAEDPFALSRIIMTSDIRGDDLGSLLAGDSLPIAPPRDRLMAVAWRVARRAGYALRHFAEQPIAGVDERAIVEDQLKTGGGP